MKRAIATFGVGKCAATLDIARPRKPGLRRQNDRESVYG